MRVGGCPRQALAYFGSLQELLAQLLADWMASGWLADELAGWLGGSQIQRTCSGEGDLGAVGLYQYITDSRQTAYSRQTGKADSSQIHTPSQPGAPEFDKRSINFNEFFQVHLFHLH